MPTLYWIQKNPQNHIYTLYLNLNIIQFGKMKFFMTELENDMEINYEHIDFSKMISISNRIG